MLIYVDSQGRASIDGSDMRAFAIADFFGPGGTGGLSAHPNNWFPRGVWNIEGSAGPNVSWIDYVDYWEGAIYGGYSVARWSAPLTNVAGRWWCGNSGLVCEVDPIAAADRAYESFFPDLADRPYRISETDIISVNERRYYYERQDPGDELTDTWRAQGWVGVSRSETNTEPLPPPPPSPPLVSELVYPDGLPAPTRWDMSGRERRARSEIEGLPGQRGRWRERILDIDAEWVYTAANMAVWKPWYEDTLKHGLFRFTMRSPGRGGWLDRVTRYRTKTVKQQRIGMGAAAAADHGPGPVFRISATVEQRDFFLPGS